MAIELETFWAKEKNTPVDLKVGTYQHPYLAQKTALSPVAQEFSAISERLNKIAETEGIIDGINKYNDRQKLKTDAIEKWKLEYQGKPTGESMPALQKIIKEVDDTSPTAFNSYGQKYLQMHTPAANEAFYLHGATYSAAMVAKNAHETIANSWEGIKKEAIETKVADMNLLMQRAASQQNAVGIPLMGEVVNKEFLKKNEEGFIYDVVKSKLTSNNPEMVSDVVDNWGELKKRIPSGKLPELQKLIEQAGKAAKFDTAVDFLTEKFSLNNPDEANYQGAFEYLNDPKNRKALGLDIIGKGHIQTMLHQQRTVLMEEQDAQRKENFRIIGDEYYRLYRIGDRLGAKRYINEAANNGEIAEDQVFKIMEEVDQHERSKAMFGMQATEFSWKQEQRSAEEVTKVAQTNILKNVKPGMENQAITTFNDGLKKFGLDDPKRIQAYAVQVENMPEYSKSKKRNIGDVLSAPGKKTIQPRLKGETIQQYNQRMGK